MEDFENENNENVQIVSDEDQPIKTASPTKKKRRRNSGDKSFNEQDDGATCAVCLENFHSGGDHRLVSLKCGHIFGDSCIRRWFQQAKSCPQCKTKATFRDIRFIYATKIKIYDNSNEIELQKTIQILTEEKNRLLTENSVNNFKIITQTREIRRLTEELESLRNNAHSSTGRAGIRTIKTGRMYLEKNLDFKEDLGCRWMDFLSRNKKLIVTLKSAGSSLFPGFGVKLIDFATYRQEKFINTSSKVLNDFSVDATENYVVTVSREAACKMYSISSNSSVCSFAPAAVQLWSCSFDKERSSNVHLGAQNGSTYIYDIRSPNEVLREVLPLNNRTPVKYIIPMKRTESFPQGGFFVIHLRGMYFYEYLPSGEVSSNPLNFNDPVMVASYDDRTEMLLITKSPTGQGMDFAQTKHILMKLIKDGGVPILQEIYSFDGSRASLPSITRPSQIKVPDGFIVVSYLEDTKVLQARSQSVGLLHEANISDAINDICPIYLENSVFFGALSNSRCRLFKINLGY